MNRFEELKNDYRSNLIIDLYKLTLTLKEPLKIRYERWSMDWNGLQITITFDDNVVVEYSAVSYKLNQRVSHQNKVPLFLILSNGK